jgi:hypothetical protein
MGRAGQVSALDETVGCLSIGIIILFPLGLWKLGEIILWIWRAIL